mmetsp:Transcript_19753/g.44853  ORF Transcript_19753/g.44853 Transcript_19753/m.44853 type:complete len:246 (-) Transcript_19753:154-891(-)
MIVRRLEHFRRGTEAAGAAVDDLRDERGTPLPPTEVLGEGRGVLEHFCKIHDPCDVPVGEVLIEAQGAFEHGPHSRHLADVPRRDIAVEMRGVAKHELHRYHVRNVPCSQRAVEKISVIKHSLRFRNFRNVPLRNVVVQAVVPEQEGRIPHARYVPVVHASVRLAVAFALRRADRLRHVVLREHEGREKEKYHAKDEDRHREGEDPGVIFSHGRAQHERFGGERERFGVGGGRGWGRFGVGGGRR